MKSWWKRKREKEKKKYPYNIIMVSMFYISMFQFTASAKNL